MRATAIVDGVLGGDVRVLARALTEVENRTPAGFEILRGLYAHTGKCTVLGITGSPGVGKSTLVHRLAGLYRGEGRTLAIVAVDPSSPFTGGAVLGDRIRMAALSTDPGVFIRSMAARGNLGGLAAATIDVVRTFDAAGRDPVIVETVGVGQAEVDIVQIADVSVVVLAPGLGDDVQALKAGVMEIGDIFVVNKADLPGADKLAQIVEGLLALGSREDGWTPPVIKASAGDDRDDGVAAVREAIGRFGAHADTAARRGERRRAAARRQLMTLLVERLMEKALDAVFPDGADDAVNAVADRERDPYTTVEAIVRAARFEPWNGEDSK
jgi:LAO/AO transport system kinase